MSFGVTIEPPANVNLVPDCSAQAPGSSYLSREADGLMGQSFGQKIFGCTFWSPCRKCPQTCDLSDQGRSR